MEFTLTIKLLIGLPVLLTFLVSCGNNPQPTPPTPFLVIQNDNLPSAGSCRSGMVLIEVNDEQKTCLDVYEVTNKAYQECVDEEGCSEPKEAETQTPPYWQKDSYYGNPAYSDHPVIQVSWYQANDYCKFMKKRLPTSEEWNKAADYAKPELSQIKEPGEPKAVGSLEDVSKQGVHDLARNVREWVADSHGISKLVRGKSFSSTEGEAKHYPSDTQDWAIGFRCASDQR